MVTENCKKIELATVMSKNKMYHFFLNKVWYTGQPALASTS